MVVKVRTVERSILVGGLTTAILIVIVPLWLLWMVAAVVLIVARPFILYPLVFARLGGAATSAWFAYTGAWSDAAQAALVTVIAGGLLVAYVAVMEHIAPDDPHPTCYPPWWWY
jgi:hypothetical protein